MNNFPLEINSTFIIDWVMPWAAFMAICAIINARNKKREKNNLNKAESERGLAKYNYLCQRKNKIPFREKFCFITMSILASHLIYKCFIEGLLFIIICNVWIPKILDIAGIYP